MMSTLTELDEKALFSRYAKGDVAAFRVFYERVSPKIWSFVRKRVPNQSTAEEIYQDAWTKIHRLRDRYDNRLEPLPWIYVITRSVLIDTLRSDQSNIETAMDPEQLEQKSDAERDDSQRFLETRSEWESEDVDSVLAAIPADQRDLLQKRYRDDLSFAQIAAEAGVREDTIRKRISRILKKIRRVR